MAFQQNPFLFSLIIYVMAVVIILTLFPLSEKTTERVYNYELSEDEYKTKEDITGILLIGVLTIGILLWWATRDASSEKSIARTGEDILHDINSMGYLAQNHISLPCRISTEMDVGESTIGRIKFMKIYNDFKEAIYVLAIANDNYNTTEIRQKYASPIISVSDEFMETFSALETIKFSERRTLDTQIDSILGKVDKLDPAKREYVLKRLDKAKEDDDNG